MMRKQGLVIGLVCWLCLIAAPLAADAPEGALWWNERVFYQVFVRSFLDSDGDGIGDLRGLIDQLDYLNDGDPTTGAELGITGLWLMPIMPAASYHGYDVIDFYDVAPEYGTLDDVRELIAQAHARGIAVILDLPINHTSTQHPWFIASAAGDPAYADWYLWADEDPGYRGPQGQVVWHELGGRYYYGVFWGGMPDLNLENPEVTAALYDITRFWLEEVGVDGFRLDAIKHLIEDGRDQVHTEATRAWLRDYQNFIKSVNPNALTVGEVWDTSFRARDYVRDGAVDLVFEFDLADAMLQSARQGTNTAIASMQQRMIDLYPLNQFATFLTNHDQNRVMSVLAGNAGAARTAASLLLTAPGVPFIYYGEEIGLTGVKPDERIRTPMPWDATPVTAGFTEAARPWQPLASGHEDGVNVAAQRDDSTSLLNHYRALIDLRRSYPVLSVGGYHALEASPRSIYSFLRSGGEDTLLILINLSGQPVEEYALRMRGGPFTSLASAELLFGDSLEDPVEIALPELTLNGDFAGYQPLPLLPAHSTTVIRLLAP
jgi:alpha-amylase